MDSIKLLMLVTCVVTETICFQFVGRKLKPRIWETILLMIFFNIVAVITSHSFGIIEKGDLSGYKIMRMSGAILLMPIPFWLVCKWKKWPMAEAFDALTLMFVVGLILMRLNCIIHGCCTGVMIPGLGLRVPLRELEIIMFALFLIRYIPRFRADTTKGTIYPILMIWYGVYRFVAEWFRVEYYLAFGIVHWAHIWSLLLLIVGLSVYCEMKSKQTKQMEKQHRQRRCRT